MRLRSTLRVTRTWPASAGAIATPRITPVAASLHCLTTISPLAPQHLLPVVVTLTSRAALAPYPKCRRLFTVALVSIEATVTTQPPFPPFLSTRVRIFTAPDTE
jgi:hypothetical protein